MGYECAQRYGRLEIMVIQQQLEQMTSLVTWATFTQGPFHRNLGQPGKNTLQKSMGDVTEGFIQSMGETLKLMFPCMNMYMTEKALETAYRDVLRLKKKLYKCMCV